jgi:hypothetical protein
MADDTTQTGFTVVAVPADIAPAVIDFVANLEENEADVSGHMLSRPIGGIGGGALAAKGRTLSGCWQTGGTEIGLDWNCSDTDQP